MSVTYDKTRQRWRIEVWRNGRRVTRKTAPAGATKADAEAYEASVLLSAFRGELGKRPEYLIEDAISRWLKEDAAGMKSYRQTCNHIQQLLPYLKGRLLTEAPQIAEEYLTKNHDLAPATLYQRVAILRRVANLAYKRWDWVEQPIGQKVRMPRVNNARHIYPTYDDVLRLLIAAPNQGLEDAVLLAFYTGMRRGELCKLKLKDVDQDLFILENTKNGRPRLVPIHPALEDAIFRLPIPYKPDSLTAAFAELAASIGWPELHLHDLRHGAASDLIKNGATLQVVGDMLGHANIKTTQRYAHLEVDHLREAMLRRQSK